SQNKDYRGKQGEFVNIFRRLAFCKCGAPMNATVQSEDYRQKVKWKRHYRYLRCAKKSTGGRCKLKYSLRLDEMEMEFFGVFLLQDPRAISETNTAEAKALTAAMTACQSNIASLTKEIKKLTLANDGLGVEELRTQIAALDKERSEEKAKHDALS